jgi:hypothetical protein
VIEKTIKRKRLSKFLFSFLVAIPVLTLNLISIENNYDGEALNSIASTISIEQNKNSLLINELEQLKLKYKELDSNAVNNIELRRKIGNLCSFFVKTGLIAQCSVNNIDYSREFINVSTVYLDTGDEKDNLIIKELFIDIFNIKNILEEPNMLIIDIYKQFNK